ncbi:PK beta-barrel-protein domain-containing protein-like protein [Hypoxylon trugodes]|uniref:PK beta-barrel-protein domain-containing protein-like protein n=1 Tax=Hypoxylon trugodes TaxID=326681 RepID=UPI0021A1EDEE|nr:PK beta-barrel-protein domain-containing protein-like protein [Hypoxylon trugodes]KAI1390071.1 PK beta-barrel-protein domain-containing protein-like protein [Hypoxylon trugodes]
MSPASDIDLFAPFERDVILEIRTSQMKAMPGLKIQTGIDKKMRTGRIPVSFAGLDADEHDLVFHGGPDKAIHGYCCTHYTNWQKEFPEAAARFARGGFGENFVTERMNERNVCIGDIVSVGTDGVLLQVSLPRQPCFKLNHRFQLKNFAPNTFKTSRTGWYYRVLREGSVQAGDEIRLAERRWPKWTIERVQEYLHRVQDNAEMNEELAAVADMGDESRKAFEKRVEKLKAKKKRAAAAANGNSEEVKEKWRDFKIIERKIETPRITSFTLEAVTPDPDIPAPQMDVGSHVRLKLPNGLLRSYSIVSGDRNKFELGIALEDQSRGGSAYMHHQAKIGSTLQVGRVTSDIKPASAASCHVFIAGGIGITAFLSLLEIYQKIHYEAILHYGVREAPTDIPFRDRIEGLGDIVKVYDRAKGQRMDIKRIFEGLPWNSHVYVCGPTRMMDEAIKEAKRRGMGEDEVHFEAFGAETGGDPFDVQVFKAPAHAPAGKKTNGLNGMTGINGTNGVNGKNGTNSVSGGKLLQVGAEETLLEVLRKHFGDDDVPSSCEVGNCGTCKVTLRSGRVEHRGTALGDDEKNDAMLSCVSRGIGKIAIEI